MQFSENLNERADAEISRPKGADMGDGAGDAPYIVPVLAGQAARRAGESRRGGPFPRRSRGASMSSVYTILAFIIFLAALNFFEKGSID